MNDICMFCFQIKGQYEVCPYCGHVEGTPPAQPYYLHEGTVLAEHFLVGPVIGEGKSGITYRCYDQNLGVMVAIKEYFPFGMATRASGSTDVGLVSPGDAVRYRTGLKHFVREAQNIARFDKAGDIVNVFDFFEANQTAYIVMELLEGKMLSTYLSETGVMEPQEAIRFIHPLIQTIKKIHSVGIIHRDICPDNICLTNDGGMKLFDFGSAIFLGEEEPVSGVPTREGYSASELYVAGADSGFYTDVYSLGAILYRMVTGEQPPSADQRLMQDILVSPKDRGVSVDPAINSTILEALSLQPELRTPGVTLFEESLMGRRRAYAPEEKLKRKKGRKILGFSFLFGGLALAGVATWLILAFLSAGNEMLYDTIDPGTQIQVWVEDQETGDILESIVDAGTGEFTNVSAEADDRTREVAEDNKNVTGIEIRVVDNMQQSLSDAMAGGEKPDMFISDHVNLPEIGYAVEPLKDTVLEAVDTGNYVGLDETTYDSICPGGEYIPTRWDMLFYYAFDVTGGEKKQGYRSNFFESEESTLEAQALLDQEDEFFSVSDLYVRSLAGLLVSDSAEIDEMVRKLLGRDEKARESYRGPGGITGMGQVAGSGAHASLPAYKERDSETGLEMGKVSIFPIVKDGKARVKYCRCFSVTADSSDSEKLACERLIWTMLGEAAQINHGFKPDNTWELPMFKGAMEEYLRCTGLPSATEKLIQDSSYQVTGESGS